MFTQKMFTQQIFTQKNFRTNFFFTESLSCVDLRWAQLYVSLVPQPILFRNFLLQSRSKWLCNSLHLFPFSLSQDVFDRLTRSERVSTSHHLFSLFQFSIFSKLNWGILFFLAALAVLYLHMGRTKLLNEWVTNDYKFERWSRRCASS